MICCVQEQSGFIQTLVWQDLSWINYLYEMWLSLIIGILSEQSTVLSVHFRINLTNEVNNLLEKRQFTVYVCLVYVP